MIIVAIYNHWEDKLTIHPTGCNSETAAILHVVRKIDKESCYALLACSTADEMIQLARSWEMVISVRTLI